ncbi:MAG: HAD-IA family hydrolase [Rubricella sp.]
MQRFEAVVFDIGNVLLEWNYEAYYTERFGAEVTARFLAETDMLAAHFLTDAGAGFSETIRAHEGRHPDWAHMIRLWREDWIAMCAPVIDGSVALMREVQARGTPVFALSNFGAENFEWTANALPFLREFDRAFISGRMKMAKPDPAIYAAVEQESGLPGHALFFIDDREENCAAAEQRGWRAHRFETPDRLRPDLEHAGLL